MNKQDWGNHDPARRSSEQSQQHQPKFSYLKLYYTIVAAILTAGFIVYVISLLFMRALVEIYFKT